MIDLRDDNFLMTLVKDGDQEAYNEIVKKYRIPAISFADSFLADLYAAEDVVQEVFVNIYLKRAAYRPIYEFKTFLFQSVRNKCIDYLRKRKIRTALDLDSIAEPAAGHSAEQEVLARERERFLFKRLSSLKKDYKTALYLYAVEGASYREIAQIMKKTVPQIKILIFRARQRLKSQYQEVYGDEK